jgi:predicted metal-binding membrane protein
MWAARSDNRVFLPVLVTLVVGAWLSLALWGASPAANLLDHDTLGHTAFAPDSASLAIMAAFVGGWTLMTVAMMLPTVIPLLDILRRTAGPALAAHATASAVAGYLAVWSVFGVGAHAGDYLLHQVVEANAWLHANQWIVGVAPLLVAGVYQFSPLKHLCLDKCRSPFSFVAARWRGDRPRLRALRIGIDHGVFCLGCCWALMLLMFAVSAGNLAWMLLLAAVMGVEKNASWGHRLTHPAGVVLLTAGLTLVALNV